MNPPRRSEASRGALAGVAAYVIWGLFPLYWPLLEPAGAIEILAHRVLWSAVCMGVVVVALRRGPVVRALWGSPRQLGFLVVAAVVVTINWGTYIWAVNHAHVVEASLGYFINPLVTVMLGVLVLGERLRRVQWLALGIAALAVVVLSIDLGRPPWIALVLAFSFGTYGLAKKKADAGAVESLTIETVMLAPLAIAWLILLQFRGGMEFGANGVGHASLLIFAGVLTAVPLVLFGAAATRISLVTLGLLQYIAPIMQFALGVFWFKEAMPPGRWIGFALVWLALVLFTVEAIRHRRRQLLLAATASAL